jgi:hypothetical protein
MKHIAENRKNNYQSMKILLCSGFEDKQCKILERSTQIASLHTHSFPTTTKLVSFPRWLPTPKPEPLSLSCIMFSRIFFGSEIKNLSSAHQFTFSKLTAGVAVEQHAVPLL